MTETGSAEAGSRVLQHHVAKKRRTTRTALACAFCRQRKAKCSGEWPACSACSTRKQPCLYPGQHPVSTPRSASRRDTNESHVEDQSPLQTDLPSDDVRRSAIAYFRENYAPTLLCFLSPQQLIEDDVGEKLSLPLLLCILALASRSIQCSATAETSLPVEADHYANLARKELRSQYNDPSLVTIQCCLILCVYEVGEGYERQGWLRLGHAARLAQLLRLHKLDSELGLMDWGSSPKTYQDSTTEAKRRTFWSCFCLERLLANGRDRIATFRPADVTTQLPQSDEDFIFGRNSEACTLACSNSDANHVHDHGSLLAMTVRIVHILSKVVTWHGRGGRHVDARCPWLPDMPFSVLDNELCLWQSSVPDHLKYTKQNILSVLAIGQGKLWSFMWLVFFQTRAYLHREYLPFTPRTFYDPREGPCDGPKLVPDDAIPPPDFWYTSASIMISSANAISDLHKLMRDRNLSASAYPMFGSALLIAASVHVVYSIFSWDSVRDVATLESSQTYLKQDMEGLNHLGQKWSLAIHWIRQVSLFYKLNSSAKKSWTNHYETPATTLNIREIKDGVMNFLRELSLVDRDAWDANVKPVFDFDSWLSVLENSIGQNSVEQSETDTQPAERHVMLELGNMRNLSYFDSLDQLASMSQLEGLPDFLSDNVDIWI